MICKIGLVLLVTCLGFAILFGKAGGESWKTILLIGFGVFALFSIVGGLVYWIIAG